MPGTINGTGLKAGEGLVIQGKSLILINSLFIKFFKPFRVSAFKYPKRVDLVLYQPDGCRVIV